MQTAEIVKDIIITSERIKSDAPHRFSEAATPGDAHRQGDIYITLLDGVPDGAVADDNPSRQLAEGNSIGSRHTLSTLDGVRMFRLPEPGIRQIASLDRIRVHDTYEGPVLAVDRDEVTIEHPEHGDIVLPRGVYGVTYQRVFDAEQQRERRAID